MAKRTFKFDKLIRDKILDTMHSTGYTVHDKKLTGAELVAALKNKLLEEAHEVAQAKSLEELKEELADLQEVISALTSICKIDPAEIERIRVIKNQKKGGFADGVYVLAIDLDESNPEVNRYLAKPNQYPEMD